MIDRADMLISFMFEVLIFIYYTNSTMYPRKSYLWSDSGIILGYIMLYIISMYNIPFLNAAAFAVINFTMIYLLFKTKLKNAVIQTLVLTAIMMVSEGILSMLTDIGAEVNSLEGKMFSIKMIHAVLSKLLYFVGIVLVKFISRDKAKYENTSGFLNLMIIPVFTIMLIVGIMSVFQNISEEKRLMFAFLSVFGVASNIVVYWMYDKTLMYHKELQELQRQKYKNDLELNYCNMLEDKLQQTRIMRHDFKEHLNILSAYISSDNKKAMDYLKSIEIKSDAINIADYTNNKVLNILLSEKQKLCGKKGIDLKIHTSDIELDFMQDIDIVSVFSNLLNNAIESCEKSEKKIIYLNITKMNNAFLVIKIENSCDRQPIADNGFYKSTKAAEGEHGIGLRSVEKALKKYGGDLRMEHDINERFFRIVIMLPLV